MRTPHHSNQGFKSSLISGRIGNPLYLVILLAGLTACQVQQQTGDTAREPLEAAMDTESFDQFVTKARRKARETVPKVSLAEVDALLRPNDKIYWPEGDGPFSSVLFFHGCSGPTRSHERDWAQRFNEKGIALISVDSFSGRKANWEEVCNLEVLLPWERAADVFSTVSYVRQHEKLKSDEIYLSGFSHGAITIWAAQVFASSKTLPIGLTEWPDQGLEGVKASFQFYGTCIDSWNVQIDTTVFLGEEDRYIDQTVCTEYAKNHPESAGSLSVIIYENATHTFDHADPNPANIEAGSIYNEDATLAAWDRILAVIGR